MHWPVIDDHGFERVARDGVAVALTARIGLMMIVLTGSFVITLLLASVRDVVTATISTALPTVEAEVQQSGG